MSPHILRTATDIGFAIRARRRALGLRQADLAMQVGISLPTISAIEGGKQTAQIGIVLQILHDLGLDLHAEER